MYHSLKMHDFTVSLSIHQNTYILIVSSRDYFLYNVILTTKQYHIMKMDALLKHKITI